MTDLRRHPKFMRDGTLAVSKPFSTFMKFCRFTQGSRAGSVQYYHHLAISALLTIYENRFHQS